MKKLVLAGLLACMTTSAMAGHYINEQSVALMNDAHDELFSMTVACGGAGAIPFAGSIACSAAVLEGLKENSIKKVLKSDYRKTIKRAAISTAATSWVPFGPQGLNATAASITGLALRELATDFNIHGNK